MDSKLVILFFLLYTVKSQDDSCDYQQTVKANTVYYINSPNYPDDYPAGSDCRWAAECPSGYDCQLNCTNIDIPQSNNCNVDRLQISRTGDGSLEDAGVYCGSGSLSVVSTGQNITVGLKSSKTSAGGKFQCELTAKNATSSDSA